MSKPLKIALIGFGNIGTGVVRHLQEHGALIEKRLGRALVLKTICDIDLTRDRGVSTQGIHLTSDYLEAVRDPEIEVVIELVGGTRIARQVVVEALEAGKHVVTANKALIATFGGELFEHARGRGVQLLFEASVGAGIPIIRALQTGLLPDRIRSMHGILNGTCNYILSTMEDKPGTEFQVVLEEAMRLGYAEPDPTLDVEGIDAAHKIAIMGSLAFDRDLRIGDVTVCGIKRLSPEDFEFAAEMEQTIKLLSTAELNGDGEPVLTVWPTFVPVNHPVGRVRGVTNTLWVNADPIGPTMYSGAGAGQGSTSSGILSDICLIAQAGDGAALDRLNPLRIANGERRRETAPAPHPRRYLRVAITGRDAQAVVRAVGLPVLRQTAGGISFVAPQQTPSQRQVMLEGMENAGISAAQVSEIRYALQGDEDPLAP